MSTNDFSLNTVELLAIAKKLGLIKESLAFIPSTYSEVKDIKTVTHCSLCNTVSTQYFRLGRFGNSWKTIEEGIKDEHDHEYELKPKAELYRTKVPSCWNCETTLLKLSKEDLVSIIMHRYALTLRKKRRVPHE